ncbi:hypothetical protein HCA69_12290 [Listeria grandensis]|uniref:Polymer-forming cytoskeletal protein n=1 Tax=Listeria grandensis TaxID=1494963 RepID=A0A7X1CQL0_9LIST|nr:hypothetical protein [Listeria grandensis]MBC1937151.1 hypothetical protein [Listeria grandensis]
MKKYEFTGETKKSWGSTVKRIVAVRDFSFVKKGDIGGWIKSEENLSHEGDCWVADEATVLANARVQGDAVISDTATMLGAARAYDRSRVADEACVSDEACVFNDALVSGGASIRGRVQVYDYAIVLGDTVVSGRSEIKGNACIIDAHSIVGQAKISGPIKMDGKFRIGGNANIQKQEDFVCISNVGSEKGTLSAYRAKDGGIEVTRGCFRGTPVEFREAVQKTHGDSKIAKEYLALMDFLTVRFASNE